MNKWTYLNVLYGVLSQWTWVPM